MFGDGDSLHRLQSKRWFLAAIGTIALVTGSLSLGASPVAAQDGTTEPTSGAATDPLLDQIHARVTLKICVAVAPAWVIKQNDGSLVGMEIDTGTAIAAELGVTPEWVETTWATLVPSLLSGQCDTIITGSSQTDARKEVVDFSIPYDPNGQVFMYRADNPKIHALEDINKPDVTVVYIGGTAVEPFMDKFFPEAGRRLLSGGAEATLIYEEINSGQADTSPIPSSLVPALKVRFPWAAFLPETPQEALDPIYAGIAVRKGEGTEYLNIVNSWLARANESSYWQEQYDKWFTPEALGL